MRKEGKCPVRIRSDFGTENPHVRSMQLYLWEDQISDENPPKQFFLYGKSTSNQRIEAYWSILRYANYHKLSKTSLIFLIFFLKLDMCRYIGNLLFRHGAKFFIIASILTDKY